MLKSPFGGGEGRYTRPHCEPLESTVTETPVTTAPLLDRLPVNKKQEPQLYYMK
jgi:hypothetical protein